MSDDEKLLEVTILRSEDARGTVWLEDGARLFFRTIVKAVALVEGQKDSDGNPVYRVAHEVRVTQKKANRK